MESLGYVECNGLSGAIVAADRMLKTADVKLSSIQNTKGNGWVTLQVSGELSAVSVAVQSVKEALPGVYVTSTVIGRPASGINTLGKTDLLKPTPKKEESQPVSAGAETITPAPVKDSIDEEVNDQSDDAIDEQPSEGNDVAPTDDTKKVIDSEEKQDPESDNEVTCNMCGDPKCPRKLGEPHKKCIHYNELKKK